MPSKKERGITMTVYAVIYSIGISSGYTKLISLCSTMEKAEKIKQADMKQNCNNEWHYSIKPIDIDKTVNITYQEW